MKKDFNKEISKYPVYYLEERYDNAGNKLTPHIVSAYWVSSVNDYNHYELELHHVVPFTDWEKNTKNVREIVSQALILLPKKMHQHLENPIYKLSKADFERVYKINPDKILFDINSKQERTASIFYRNLFIQGGKTTDNYPDCIINNAPVSFKLLEQNPFEECA